MAIDQTVLNDNASQATRFAAPSEALVNQLTAKDYQVLSVATQGNPLQLDGSISFGDAHKGDQLSGATASPELKAQLNKAGAGVESAPGVPSLTHHPVEKLTEHEGSGLLQGKERDISGQYPAIKQYNERAQKEIYGPAQEHYAKAVGDLDRNWPNHDKLEAERKQYKAAQTAYDANKGNWGIGGPAKPHMGPEMQKFAAECEKIKAVQDAAAKFAERDLKQNMENNTPGFKEQERQLHARQLAKSLEMSY